MKKICRICCFLALLIMFSSCATRLDTDKASFQDSQTVSEERSAEATLPQEEILPEIENHDACFNETLISDFASWLDQEGFVKGVSQGDFLNLMRRYQYRGQNLVDAIPGANEDGVYGGGYDAEADDDVGFLNYYESQNGVATYTNSLRIETAEVENFSAPFEVQFGDSLSTVLNKMEIEFDPSHDFVADEGAPSDITLARCAGSSFVYRVSSKNQSSSETECYLIYTETKHTTRTSGRAVTVTRSITFGFEEDRLARIQIAVKEVFRVG